MRICVFAMNDSLVSQLHSLIRAVDLTRQDVLELTECVIQEYLDQQHAGNSLDKDQYDQQDEHVISVSCDSEGDYIDEEGYIYDIKSRIRIGQKDLKTKEKTMFNVI